MPWFWSKIRHFSVFLFQAIQAMKMCFTIFQNEKTLLQAIRTRISKSRKIESFPKGLVHGFVPKLAIFSIFSFQSLEGRKMCFTIFQKEKTPLQAIKTRSSKRRKIESFPKRLVHGFGPKLAIFPCFYFGQYRPGKCVLGYSRRKKRLFRL